MKVAYAGFDLMYPALQTLADEGHDIVKIYSCKTDNVCEFNTKVTAFAHSRNIPITYERITVDDLKELCECGCEVLICAGYYYRIPIHEKLRMINIHPALLPVGRGAWPMPVTILREIEKSGVTIHKIEESFDTGAILMQMEFSVAADEDLESFMGKVCDIIPHMLRELLSDFDRYYINAAEQGEGEYWECPNEAEYIITEGTPYSEAELILRAFMGFECIYRGRDKTYALQYGRAVPEDGSGRDFPVSGGYIYAPKVREIQENDTAE